jgi:D-threo-aldose 1-dehydrogenase
LQFSLAHPATAAVIPGASKPERIAEDYAALNTRIPDDFWHELRNQHLVAANAPLPVDNLTRHGGLDIIKPRPSART